MAEILRSILEKNLAPNGHVELPGGLIVKWGNFSMSVTNKVAVQGIQTLSGWQNILFPAPFPNDCLALAFANLDSNLCASETMTYGNKRAAGFEAMPSAIPLNAATASATLGGTWIALGY